MRRMALALAAVSGVVCASQEARAQQIECGGVYAVQRGDTLATIARKAYGHEEFQLIYLANADVIGADPNLIEVGMPLRIPCLTEAAADQAAPVAAPAGPEAVRPAPIAIDRRNPSAPQAAFIGVDRNAPFSGADLPEGGMFTELLRLAVQRGGGVATKIDFAPDWNAQLAALLPGGGYEVGFPWVRPDCEAPATLGAESRARCRSFVYSVPFLDVVLGFYTMSRSDFAAAKTHEALLGARICRPDGMFQGDLEAEKLVEPAVSRVSPPSSLDCFRALLVGEVDVVSTDAAAADEALAQIPGAARRVAEIEGLATLHTLHAVAPRGDALGLRTIEMLNEGLGRMRASGEWFAAVQKSRAATAAAN